MQLLRGLQDIFLLAFYLGGMIWRFQIEYYGVYRFKNYAYQNGQVLNAYGSSSLENGRNVMLYTRDENDTAQQWRAMYAGKYGEHTLYWLNCVLGGMKEPYALDRFTGALKNNTDVYLASESSAQDQLVYFTKDSWTGAFYIHLYDLKNSNSVPSGLVLTAAPNPNGVNGNNSPTSLTQAGNVYWSVYADGNPMQKWMVEEVSPGDGPNFNEMATDFPYDKYYLENMNSNYPNYVAECVWYCKGRFLEVNEIANCCSGHAYKWETNPLVDEDKIGREVGNPDTITLRPKSVAVFGRNNVYVYGHVVFIEEITDTDVIYSHCNGTSLEGKLGISNGEIEVRNSIVPFDKAQDGCKIECNKNEFRYKFGSGLKAIIYKL